MINLAKYFSHFVLLIFLSCAASKSKADLIYCASPGGGIHYVRQAVEIDRRDLGLLKRIPPDQLTIFDPLGFYNLDLITNITKIDPAFLSKAEFACWQYLLLEGTNAIGGCDVFPNYLSSETSTESGLFNNGFSKETLTALKTAAKLPQVNADDFEIRRLSFTFVSFQAIWLHGKAYDIIIPLPRGYPDTAKYFTAYKPYNERQMAKILRSMFRDELMRHELSHRF